MADTSSDASVVRPAQGDGPKRKVRARRLVKAKSHHEDEIMPAKDVPSDGSRSASAFEGSIYSGVHSSAVGSAEEAMKRLESLEKKQSVGSMDELEDDGIAMPSAKRRKRHGRNWDVDLLASADVTSVVDERAVKTAGESTEGCGSLEERTDRPLTPPPMDITSHPLPHSRTTNVVLREYSDAIGSLQHIQRPPTVCDSADLIVSEVPFLTDDDGEITVKVRSREGILRFLMKKSDTVARLVSQFSERLGVPAQHISLWKGEQALPLEKTISSAGLKLTDILDSTVANPTTSNSVDSELVEGNMITLKVQDKRKSRSFRIGKAQTFQELCHQYCEAAGVDMKSVKFSFDGDPLDMMQTPMDLDMDDDEIIDAKMIT